MLLLAPRLFSALGIRVSQSSRLLTASVCWWRGWLRLHTRRAAARRMRLRQRQSVRPGLELLESRELLSSTPGMPEFSALRDELTQLRNDVTASAVALMNTVQPSSSNTPTLVLLSVMLAA